MTAHHTYPNDPLALVLVELRHPVIAPPAPSAMTVLKEELREWTPILDKEHIKEINFETGEQTALTLNKLVARDRRTAITFRPDAMTLEMTDYPGWKTFRTIIHAIVAARQDLAPVDGCNRIGLRYINEIRVPVDAADWSRWVVSSLLGPQDALADLKLATRAQQHVVQCEGPHAGDSLTLRYGAARGAVIRTTPTLQRLKEAPAEGEFFLVDIDSAWADPQNAVPVLDSDLIDVTAERLHGPVGTLFESLITSDLRTQMLQQLG